MSPSHSFVIAVLISGLASATHVHGEEKSNVRGLWAVQPAVDPPILTKDQDSLQMRLRILPRRLADKIYRGKVVVHDAENKVLRQTFTKDVTQPFVLKLPQREGLITFSTTLGPKNKGLRKLEGWLYKGDFKSGRAQLGKAGAELLKRVKTRSRAAAAARFADDWSRRPMPRLGHRQVELFAQVDWALRQYEKAGKELTRKPIPGAITNPLHGKLGPKLLRFWWILPDGYAKKKDWPLVIFLHGSEGRFPGMTSALYNPVRTAVQRGDDIPAVVLIGKTDETKFWEPRLLNALLDWTLEQFTIDADRVLVTGLSLGGKGSWEWAMHSPKRIAAIAPLAGNANPLYTQKITHIPVWNTHGMRDKLVDYYLSQHLVDSLRYFGGKVRNHAVPDAGHNVWTYRYDSPEFWKWFLAQRRQPVRNPKNALKFNDQGISQGRMLRLPPLSLVYKDLTQEWEKEQPPNNSSKVRPLYQLVYNYPKLTPVGPHLFVPLKKRTRIGLLVKPATNKEKLGPMKVEKLEMRKVYSVFYSGPRTKATNALTAATNLARKKKLTPTGRTLTRVWWDDWHNGQCFREFWIEVK